jgi:nitrate reductase beta subunit
MDNKKRTKKARLARVPKKIIDNEKYSIKIIPLNFRIDTKLPKKKKYRTINRDFYCPIDQPLSSAIEIAEDAIKKYFIINKE